MLEKTSKKSTIYQLIVLMVGLFNFVFLGAEYLFDNLIGTFTDPQAVTLAQNIILGASVIGFILYGLVDNFLKEKTRTILHFIYVFIALAVSIIFVMNMNYNTVFWAGICYFVVLGIIGAKVCFLAAARIPDTNYLARTMGAAYATGIVFQFLLNNLVKASHIQAVVLYVGFLALTAIILGYFEKNTEVIKMPIAENEDIKSTSFSIIFLILTVAFLTIIFSTLDNAVTIVHASQQFDIGQWPRLLLAVSGIAAGFLFDYRRRRLMPFVMYAITILSVLCIIILQMGGSIVIALICFYVSAGFFVIFFMTSFMELSYYTKRPKLWAGIGRATNNLSAFAVSALSLWLLSTGNTQIIMMVALFLFVLISITMFVYGYYSRKFDIDFQGKVQPRINRQASEENEQTSQPEGNVIERNAAADTVADSIENNGSDRKLDLFAQQYNLTEREKEVLKIIISSEKPIQELAEELSISRAALYRHIANMNEKTETNKRRGLIQFYYDWKE